MCYGNHFNIGFVFMLHTLLRLLKWPLLRNGTLTIVALLVVLAYAVVGFMLTEGQVNPKLTFLDALWWAIVSMTTVGYGDLYPTTTASRFLVGIPTMFFGCAIVAQVLGFMADHMIKTESKKRRGLKKMKLKDHIIIVRFPSLTKIFQLVEEIRADQSTFERDIVVIDDQIEEFPEELTSLGVTFVRGDAEEIPVLERASFRDAKQIILLADPKDPKYSDLKNLSIVLSVEAKVSDIITIAEVLQPEKVHVFREAGCDSVMCLSDISSQLLVQEMQDPGLGHVMRELTSNQNGKQLYIVKIPQGINTYLDLSNHLSDKQNLLLGVSHCNENSTTHSHSSWNPPDDYRISQGDRAIIISEERPSL